MSDFHILTQDEEQKWANVVFHIPVPTTGTNQAGILWTDAVVAEQGGSAKIVSVLPGISSAEDTALKAGQLIELQTTVHFPSRNLTNAQRLQAIKDEFNAKKTSLIATKQVTLAFIGYAGSGA